MFGFYALKEERFIHRNFEFIDLKDYEGFQSPYKFDKYFYGLNYSNFTKIVFPRMKLIDKNNDIGMISCDIIHTYKKRKSNV